MVWNTFFHVCPFDREGGGDLSDLGNAHIELTHFKKGLPFPKNIPPFPQYWGREKACNDGLEHFFCINLPGGVRACQDGFMNLESRFLMFGGFRPYLQEEGRTGRGSVVRVVKP